LVVIHLFNDHDKDGMRARGDIVHLGAGSCSHSSTALHQSIDLERGAHSPFRKAFNENTSLSIFTDLETGSAITRLEEICDRLIVDLEIRCTYHKRGVLICSVLNVLENLFHGTWNDTSLGIRLEVFETFHCESLTCTCLSIG
jgi:hypothetical protein